MSARAIRRNRERQLKRAARRARRFGLAAGSAIGATVLFAPAAQAANIEVNTLADDENDGCAVGACTLRDAVGDALANSEDDLITFESSLSGTINLAQGQIDLSDSYGVEIRETGPNDVAISGDATGDGPDPGDDRIFYVGDRGPITLYGLNLTEGYTSGGGGALRVGSGNADVTVADSTITDSYAFIEGGGIVNRGALAVTGTTISGNQAGYSGGGIANVSNGFARITDSEISGNQSGYMGGGIVNKYASLTVIGTTVSGNDSGDFGGGIGNLFGSIRVRESEVTGNGPTVAIGGGIANVKYSSAEITDSEISGNAATYEGGGIAHLNSSRRRVYSGAPTRAASGSPIVTRTLIKDTTIADNTAGVLGGGVVVGPTKYGDALEINRTTISGNAATGINARAPIGETLGGGIAVPRPVSGALLVRSSTISGNDASLGGGVAFGYGERNGIESALAEGAKRVRERARAADVKPVGPQARAERLGPLAAASGEASLAIDNTTIADNTAVNDGGGIYNGEINPVGTRAPVQYSSLTVPLSSTIVADNTAEGAVNDLADAGAPDGSFELDYSLVEAPGTATVNQDPAGQSILGQDPLLGPLTDNGGPTETHEPALASAVIDTGVDNEIGRDQRIELRRVQLAPPDNPVGDPTDIGSVEVQGTLPGPVRPLREDEVPAGCPIPFEDAVRALVGDKSGQTIVGRDESDILRGAGGKDLVVGRSGDDCLTGDDGGDKVAGRGGDDWTRGGAGGDFMKGNGGDDDLGGNAGMDRLRLAQGNDVGAGGPGPDNLTGGTGADLLKGSEGDDRMFGNAGDDDLVGGFGDDTIFPDGGRNTVDCGPGQDRVVVLRLGPNEIAANCETVITRVKKR